MSLVESNIVTTNDTSLHKNLTSDNILTIQHNNNVTIPKQSTILNVSQGNENHSQWLELPKMDNFVDVFSVFCSIAVIFGGLVPYIPQYLKIKRSLNSDGFSTYGKIS